MTVTFDKGCYGVRLAQSAADIAACQALRHQVFFGAPGQDQDAFDPVCDHIMVAEAGRLIATCRVMVLPNGRALVRSYSAERYDLTGLSAFDRPMMELGRVCIAPGGRDGDALRLIWGALAQIVDRFQVAFLFGCASFRGTEPSPYRGAFAFLATRAQGPEDWSPGVRAGQIVPLTDPQGAKPSLKDLPPLLRSYVGLGGWVSDHAVVDKEMQTLHVFTGLEVAAIPARRAAAMRAVAAVGASGGECRTSWKRASGALQP